MTSLRLFFAGALMTTWSIQTPLYAQYGAQGESGADACISVDITSNGDTSDLTIDLRSSRGPTLLDQGVRVAGTGTYDLGCVSEGVYQIRIITRGKYVVHEQIIMAGSGTNFVTIRLPGSQTTPPTTHAVSFNELRKKVSRKAASELRRAREMRERSENQAAMTHVMKALEKDPDFVEAHIEAGIIHALQNDHERAAGAFRKAAELDPGSILAHGNLAITLLKLRQFSDAEQAARRTLQLDQTWRIAELALGASLGFQQRNPDEALKHLRRAVPEYPKARLFAAKVLCDFNRTSEAVNELKLYLASNVETAERAQIEAWLASVQ